MPLVLTLTNKRVIVEGAKRSELRALDAVTSYRVEGARFVKAFQQGYWDGREHLMTYSSKTGRYTLPIGLAEDVVAALALDGIDFQVVDERVVNGVRRNIEWNRSIVMRDYQLEAHASLFRKHQLLFGCGLLKLPIRAGKTKTAASVIKTLGLPTIVLVPSQMLLWQTVDSLSECFPSERIGVIGDGRVDAEDFITVATMQSLAMWKGGKSKTGKKRPRDPRYDSVFNSKDVVIVDEAHHLTGASEWHAIAADSPARFRIALSATAYLDSDVEQGRGIIWLKGSIGPQRIDISESRLIKAGYLMTQHVTMKRVTGPAKYKDWRWSMELQRDGIWNNVERNQMIVDAAKQHVDRGARTLIVTSKVEQTRHLHDLLCRANVDHETITGKDGRGARAEAIDEFVNGKLRCVVGTVLSEGVDIPVAEVVIVAGGGKDAKATMQRMRNMTIAEGKSKAELIDFMDEFNPYLMAHSKERLKVYKSIPEFVVDVER